MPENNERHQELLSLARSRFQNVVTAESHIREAAIEDIRFAYNVEEGQWDADVRSERLRDARPCLTANKLRKFIAIVANQERENRVAAKVRPVDDRSDPETAQILEDLIRHIEYASRADEIYASAGEQAAAGGFAYWRILAEMPEDGFDQEIVLRHVENPFSVYMDPKRRFCFISDWLDNEEFKSEYPNASSVDFPWQGRGEEWALWYEPNKIRVAEYFVKERVSRKLAKVRHPQTGETAVVELTDGLDAETLQAEGFEILQSRESEGHRVRWYKITGLEILEEQDWPGREIPVVEVVGDMVNIQGKIYKRSLIRDGKDPQRMYNYFLTTETETVALAPKAPFLLTPQEIAGHEGMWEEANRKNLPYLLFNPQGTRVPSRQAPPQVSSGHQAMLQLGNQDIKDTLGMYESFLGEQAYERSGRAIFARQQRSAIGTMHFPDNLRRAIVETGRILIDMIPRVYDAERVIRIRGEDNAERMIRINQTIVDPTTGEQVVLNDLSLGKYDVQADVRLYSTRRQETVELMIQTLQYAPQIAPFIVDLVFKYLDSPGAAEIEERVKRFLETQGVQGERGPPVAGGDGGQGRRGATIEAMREAGIPTGLEA